MIKDPAAAPKFVGDQGASTMSVFWLENFQKNDAVLSIRAPGLVLSRPWPRAATGLTAKPKVKNGEKKKMTNDFMNHIKRNIKMQDWEIIRIDFFADKFFLWLKTIRADYSRSSGSIADGRNWWIAIHSTGTITSTLLLHLRLHFGDHFLHPS